MYGDAAVSLRGGDEGLEEYGDRTVTWVCPGHLRKYVKDQARSRPGAKERDIYIDALELDRALEEGLAGDAARLRTFAEAQGLSLKTDFRRVILAAVKAGLDASEKKPRK